MSREAVKLQGYFIAGTDTGVGKTRITTGLLGALSQTGVRALGMKPVASGTDDAGVNEDVARIHAANIASLAASEAAAGASWQAAQNPYCFSWPVSPHLAARRAGVVIEPARILEAAKALAAQAGRGGLLLVEGTGGWLAPIGADRTMADVAETLGLPVVLVVGLRLGCLSHALLTARAIAAGPLRLAGWIGSHLDPDMLLPEENLASLDAALSPAPRLGLLPHGQDPGDDPQHLQPAAQTLWRSISH
jgi:dethiobiotin synthetase